MKDSKSNLVLIVMIVWVFTLGSFAYWFEMNTRREDRQQALVTADAFFQQILVSRLWNAQHGGVYVPITSETQPNEYLPIINRDLTADNGLKLTKINPAYMTRQIAELSKKNGSAIQFHITSLKPIRPENQATDWEKKWLLSFEQGAEKQGDFFEEGKTTWFRYMAPLVVVPPCLKCHAQQGYKEGDIRGGISISLPYQFHDHLLLIVGFGSVAAFGLICIFTFGYVYDRKHRLFDATFNSPLPTCVTGSNYTILLANEAYWAEFGALPMQQKSIKCYEHRLGKACHIENCPLTMLMGGMSQFVSESCKEIAGVSRHFIVTAKPLLDSRGKMIGCVENFQEITARKRAEAALEEANHELEILSHTDGLTGIANRRHFNEVLAREYSRHARTGAELSLIMLDIDHFKKFNDCYGHVAGDKCLQQVAQALIEGATRPADLVGRYGGEEFVCILPETSSSGAVAVAENIRREIIAMAIPHQESKVADYVTASLGVVTMLCTPERTAEYIVAQADEQLYRAKSSGRNRVEFVSI